MTICLVTDTKSPFLYNPLEAKGKQTSDNAAEKPVALWVAGETAAVEIEIWNPTSQIIQVVFFGLHMHVFHL